jgi:Grx4 family monothiol glutaredoxin
MSSSSDTLPGNALYHGDVTSEAALAELISRHARCVLNFWAPWAAPCVQMNSVFSALAAAAGPVDAQVVASPPHFVRVPAETLPSIAAEYRVASVPTFVFEHAGRVVARVEGANPALLAEKVTWFSTASAAELEQAAIVEVTQESELMLFMKGKPDSPACGFSRQIVDLLRRSGVVFGHCDVLKDPEVREGLKALHNWPTYPQLYARGRLVGGLDIVRELVDSGQLIAELARDEGEALPGAAANVGSTTTPSVSATAATADAAEKNAPPSSLVSIGNGVTAAEEPSVSDEQRVAALNARLRDLVKSARVILFMKGSPAAPQCGFSKRIVALLQEQDIIFSSFNILEDLDVRQGLKDLFKWPTFPQLYCEGSLIGGLDIVQGLVEDGSLRDELGL